MQNAKQKASRFEPCDLCHGSLDLRAYSVVSVYDVVNDQPQPDGKSVLLVCQKCRERVRLWLGNGGKEDV